ncbi:hypothetical protein HanRHA438_Chr05g0231061 [Helianthus annuus]|uniref:Uncharacterized protein n=1 Tax=Helianthus annuus TaxID=4232 RepID=A0A9K3J0E8_HELAN|nr:hypothetical protein HanXRQr2_Chr05g0222031 [Helianthus annuus]KAJ0570753.1 hypothetical protein HanHA300_Chr05g0181711 [Helianthus annuus]KAJ0577693.1 hypothetical protein HanIR_Chr05g0238931 [Helianthus annuus]KAJ0585094.1 hypothetical protein HanHA89_Chr05g0196391 [Helianthus annuus]KAJ0919558.1 hypothetical protein HanRHA438_Chr05g0231061 [Helianthus annuus]
MAAGRRRSFRAQFRRDCWTVVDRKVESGGCWWRRWKVGREGERGCW